MDEGLWLRGSSGDIHERRCIHKPPSLSGRRSEFGRSSITILGALPPNDYLQFNDDFKRQLHLSIGDRTSAEMAVLHLMDEFDTQFLSLSERGNFSNVNVYLDIASFVGFGICPILLCLISAVPEFLLHFSSLP